MFPSRRTSPRVALHAVGCKLNQYECQVWAQALAEGGCEIVDFESLAEAYVLNTCTVTSRTDRECRRLARGAKRRNPEALVVVTGCYAEVAAEDLRRRGLGDLVLGREQKAGVVGRVVKALLGEQAAAELPLLREFAGHTRAFVKAQEGCAGGCAYCLIAEARGPEQSVPSERVVAEAKLLGARHPELVLVGTHLGRYGKGVGGEVDLAGLVGKLAGLPEVRRLRVSSLEPLEVTAALGEQVVEGGRALVPDPARPAHGKLCRHLHLPLQSGSDTVLERMGRPYRTAQYAELVRQLKQRQPGLCLGADVMVGFPGETEVEFEETVGFIEGLPLSYLHVFTFSPRPGTPAEGLPGEVAGQVKKARTHVLRAVSERKRAAFAESQVGERLELVMERHAESGEVYGLSDNYLEVALEGRGAEPGALVEATIVAAEEGRVRGRLFCETE